LHLYEIFPNLGKTTKTVSGQFESKSHELLTKAGFISQLASGIFNLLPLGKIVLSKIEQIIREEMNALGAQEIQMPILHPKSLWLQSGRWENVDVLFKTQSVWQNLLLLPLTKKHHPW
jgi:prolyl-tRNA synthetase